jgi:tRNA-2-methylthio-N6-dimethylallyladenosine synthase
VNFKGPASLIGEFVDVQITEAFTNSLRGELVAEAVAAAQ